MPKPELTKQVRIRFAPEFLRQLRRAAKQSGMNVSVYIRVTLTEKLRAHNEC